MTDTITEREPIEVVPGQMELGLKPPAEPTDFSSMVQKPNATPTEMGFNFRVADDLKPLLKPVADFVPHPRNFRRHKLDAIMESLQTFGQQSPIVVQRSTGYVCKGNGTYKALAALGATHVAASIEDFDDETAFAYLVADNRTSDLAEYERDKQLKELRALAEGPGMQGTLLSLDELEDLEAEYGAVQTTQLGEFTGGYSESPEATEARKALSKQTGARLREVPVTMTVEQHKQFMAAIRVLEKKYGVKGAIATIIEAVFREAARVAPTKEEVAEAARSDVAAALAEGQADLVAEAAEAFAGDIESSTTEDPSAEELAARI